MHTLLDLVAQARERDGVLVTAGDRAAPFTYRDFCTNVWKMGNVLSHYGVRAGARVALAVGPTAPAASADAGWLGSSPTPIQTLLATTLDGAVVDPDPVAAVDATVLVAPTGWIDRYELGPGTKPIGYGEPPDDPRIAHLEEEAWSENPTAPPESVSAGTDALATGALHSHGDLLAASRRVVAEHDLREADTVAIDAPLSHAGTLVAGVIAPMRVGAKIALVPESATVTVAPTDAGATPTITPDDASP
jgi:acyl-CoA synthetase (AMP-forming)/AMP-acid ligase II